MVEVDNDQIKWIDNVKYTLSINVILHLFNLSINIKVFTECLTVQFPFFCTIYFVSCEYPRHMV